MSDPVAIDPAALMQQLRERDATAIAADPATGAADPVAVCRQMLSAYVFPRTDAAALAAVLDEVERLRADRQLLVSQIEGLSDRVAKQAELLAWTAERVERREPIRTMWGVV